jgi:antitoxin component YwqK of YwqJK toxin-antitoxin module
MTMPAKKDSISNEQKIMLLEQKNDSFHATLVRLESKMDDLDKKFESKFDYQNGKMDSHFRWTIGLIFGLYATGFATFIGAVGKAYHWF